MYFSYKINTIETMLTYEFSLGQKHSDKLARKDTSIRIFIFYLINQISCNFSLARTNFY
jgi:hypothetical protein